MFTKYIFPILAIGLLALFCLGIGEGTWQNPFTIDDVMHEIRLPRIIVSLLVGAALSASGAALQALFENPLSDPSLIGTSGGAAIGVVVVIAMGWGSIGVPLAAFLGAFGVCMLILLVHRWIGGGKYGLLVLGFVLSALCSSLVSLILFMSDDMALRSAMTWLAGSFSEAGFISLSYAASIMLIGWLILLAIGRQLDCLLLGDEAAQTMGISIAQTRTLTIIGAAMMTGAAVSLGGIIGFVGMMVPNVLARVIGGGRSRLIALAALWGAVFVLIADTFSRWIIYPIDLPVGIVISILGGPFFLWLIMDKRDKA